MVPSRTTPYHSKGMGKKRRSTRHFYPCYAPRQKTRNLGGRTVLIKLYMPIIAPVMRPLDSVIITCCAVSPQDFRLIPAYFRIKPASPTEYLAHVREWKTAIYERGSRVSNKYM